MPELRASTTQGQETVLAEKAVEEFKTRLRGKLIRRGDKDYNEARTVFNAMIDRYPALIIRCAGVADVIDSVNFAQGQQSAGSSARGWSQRNGQCCLQWRHCH